MAIDMSKYVNLIKNVGLFAFSNFAVKLITFFLVPLYTYYLSTAEYGITDMLSTVVWILTPLGTLSVADATLRFCIEKKDNARSYASVGFGITLFSCLVVACLLPCLDISFFGGLGEHKLWFLLCYAAMSFQGYFSSLSRGVGQVSVMAVASAFSAIINIVCTIPTIVLWGWGVNGFFVSLFLGNVAGCAWYLVVGKLYRYLTFDKSFIADLKPMLRYSIPLVPNALFWWMIQGINRFFITGMIGIAASGIFAAASKIPSLLKLLTGVFEQAWSLSAFQEFKSKDSSRFFNLIYHIYNSCLATCIAILIPLSQWIASFFLQKDFFSAWVLVPTLLISFYYSTLNAFYGSIYTSSMKTRFLFVTTMIGGIVCVFFNYIFLLAYGLIGACVASAISNAVVWILRVSDSRKIIEIRLNLISVILTNIVLIAMAFMTSLQVENWLILDIFLIGIMILVHSVELKPYIRILKNKIMLRK